LKNLPFRVISWEKISQSSNNGARETPKILPNPKLLIPVLYGCGYVGQSKTERGGDRSDGRGSALFITLRTGVSWTHAETSGIFSFGLWGEGFQPSAESNKGKNTTDLPGRGGGKSPNVSSNYSSF